MQRLKDFVGATSEKDQKQMLKLLSRQRICQVFHLNMAKRLKDLAELMSDKNQKQLLKLLSRHKMSGISFKYGQKIEEPR